MTKLKIKVTKDILRQSAYCPSGKLTTNCAISVAVRDIFPDAATACGFIFPFVSKTVKITIALPASAVDFIKAFDATYPPLRIGLPELEFEVDIPDDVLEHIDISELKPLLEDHPTLKLV